MKKVLMLILLVLSVSTISVSAMTKEELKNKLSASFTINGHEFQAAPDHIVQLERYLNQNELTESDMDYISSKFDEVLEILKSENISSLEEVTVRQKSKLISIVNDVSNRTSVKATVAKNTVIIYNQDGTEFTRITFLIKQTGYISLYFLGSLIVVVLGFAFLGRKIKKQNA